MELRMVRGSTEEPTTDWREDEKRRHDGSALAVSGKRVASTLLETPTGGFRDC